MADESDFAITPLSFETSAEAYSFPKASDAANRQPWHEIGRRLRRTRRRDRSSDKSALRSECAIAVHPSVLVYTCQAGLASAGDNIARAKNRVAP